MSELEDFSVTGASVPPRLTVSVLIPTYHRPDDVSRCLAGLKVQSRQPDQVVLAVRDSDNASMTVLRRGAARGLPIEIVRVSKAGQVAALNAGLESCRADLIAITDDDTIPRPDWLRAIERHFFMDPDLGGLGGRDFLYDGGKLVCGDENAAGSLLGRLLGSGARAGGLVGKVTWFGRVIGFHHLGVGAAREVDVLKGANMSFRRTAIANMNFDLRLRGAGAQVHNDLAFCLALKRRGWKLVYDPAVAVDHYMACRHDEDQRHRFSAEGVFNAAHNETLALLEHLPPMSRVAFVLYGFLVGKRLSPGILQLPRILLRQSDGALRRLKASVFGRAAGIWTYLRQRPNRASAATNIGSSAAESNSGPAEEPPAPRQAKTGGPSVAQRARA